MDPPDTDATEIAGSLPRIFGFGAGFAVIMTVFDYTGGSLRGVRTEVEGMDEYERKEYLRKNRRRPIEETIADIGEGRGISPSLRSVPSIIGAIHVSNLAIQESTRPDTKNGDERD